MTLSLVLIGIAAYLFLSAVVLLADHRKEQLRCSCGDFKADHARSWLGIGTLCGKCDCTRYDPYRKTSIT